MLDNLVVGKGVDVVVEGGGDFYFDGVVAGVQQSNMGSVPILSMSKGIWVV